MWRVNKVVACAVVFLLPKILDNAAEPRALWMPDYEAWACFVVNREQVEFPAEKPVVAASCFFESVQMFVERVLRLECSAVDALEHGAFLVAAPVRARDTEQLERRNLAG